MTQLEKIENKEFLRELKNRVIGNKISEEEVFQVLERKELITEYEIADLNKLTKEDWEKACQALGKDKNYQEEAELWDSIDDIDDEE